MNRIKLCSFFIAVLFFTQSYAQQDASFTFYNYKGNYSRGNHEVLLLCNKSKPQRPTHTYLVDHASKHICS